MRNADLHRLSESHAQSLFAFLAYRTGDRALAEDLVADTFERVLRSRRGLDRRRGTEKAWLYTIALNCHRDHLRRHGAEARAVERAAVLADSDQDSADSQAIARVEVRDSLLAALQGLSSEEREAVALRFGADLSLREIARATGESMTTVEGRVYRGLRKLRDLID